MKYVTENIANVDMDEKKIFTLSHYGYLEYEAGIWPFNW